MPSVSQNHFQRVTPSTRFDLIARTDTTSSFLSIKSLRLIRSWLIQTLSIFHLRYWTRSTGAASAATSMSKSSKLANQRTSLFWVVCTSRWSHCSVRSAFTNSRSTTRRNFRTSPVFSAPMKRRSSWKRDSARRRRWLTNRTGCIRRSSSPRLRSTWQESNSTILIGIKIPVQITQVMQVVGKVSKLSMRKPSMSGQRGKPRPTSPNWQARSKGWPSTRSSWYTSWNRRNSLHWPTPWSRWTASSRRSHTSTS